MKKLLCCALAAILVVLCCACSSSTDYSQYGDSAVVEVENATAKAGKTVDVKIYLNNNPGTATIGLELHYDTSVLTPVSAKNTGKLNGEGFFSSNLSGGDEYGVISEEGTDYVKALWFDAYNFSGNGEIMTITFQVDDNAPAGEYAITITPHEDDLTNEDLEYVDVVYLEGSVTVS